MSGRSIKKVFCESSSQSSHLVANSGNVAQNLWRHFRSHVEDPRTARRHEARNENWRVESLIFTWDDAGQARLNRYHAYVTEDRWRCPLCNTLAESARDHLAEAHGVGGGQDRFGLRDTVKHGPRRTSRDDSPVEPDEDPPRTPSSSFGPPVWRRMPPAPSHGQAPRPGDPQLNQPLTWRKAPRPVSSRRRTGEPSESAPQKPIPLPPDAAVLRLICESLDGVDAQQMGDRLRALPGVESVTLDLYARTVDLYVNREKATAAHLVALARERMRLPVHTAEVHRAAQPGDGLGSGTLIYVVQ